jgi:hypothetical protein
MDQSINQWMTVHLHGHLNISAPVRSSTADPDGSHGATPISAIQHSNFFEKKLKAASIFSVGKFSRNTR